MVKVVQFANGPVFKWHLNNRQKSPVIEWQGCQVTIFILKFCHSCFVPFEIGTVIEMVEPFEYRTLKSLILRWIRYYGVRFSNGYCNLNEFITSQNIWYVYFESVFSFRCWEFWVLLWPPLTWWPVFLFNSLTLLTNFKWNLIRISSDKSGLVQPTNNCNKL